MSWEIAILVLAFVIVGGGLPALRSYVEQLERRADARDKFFEASHRVLDDRNVPEAIFFKLAFYNQTITSPMPTRWLLWDVLTGKFKRAARRNDTNHAVLTSMSAHTRAEYERAVKHYFRAVSFNNPLIGKLYRQVVGSSLKRDAERADQTALLLHKQMRDARSKDVEDLLKQKEEKEAA
jgi:hypothetical protein